jgi:hypothetical protein
MLHLRYRSKPFEALAEGIYTGHPTMSAFQLDPDQIHARIRRPFATDLLESATLALTPPAARIPPPLQRLHRPGDHILRNSTERFAERGGGSSLSNCPSQCS